MIICSYYVFIFTDGPMDRISINNTLPYLLSFCTYFALNLLLVGIYFILEATENLVNFFKEIIKETLSTYISTLVLSLVLVILMGPEELFGFSLFTCIAFLLSLAFKQHFNLFKEISEKANKDFPNWPQ